MSLKTVKKNYISLLKAFSDAGVTLTESQKNTLDNFITDLQKTMDSQRDMTIRATKKVVEEKLEKEYKSAVESLMVEMKQNSELAGKIQQKICESEQNNRLADVVDEYLTEHVNEVLPKKTIVDYTELKRNQRIVESLRNMFMISEPEIADKIENARAEVVAESDKLRKQNETLTESIKKSNEEFVKLSKMYSTLRAREFVLENTRKLPIVESREILRKTKGMDFDQVTKNFKSILESVQDDVADQQNTRADEKDLEEAIATIMEGDKAKSEKETTSDKDAQGTEPVYAEQTENEADDDAEAEPSDEDESGQVVVAESQMRSWIETLNRITPIR